MLIGSVVVVLVVGLAFLVPLGSFAVDERQSSTAADAAALAAVSAWRDLATGSTTPFALQVEGGALVEFGAGYTDSTSKVTSTGAQYYSEDLWKEWVECS